VATLSTLVISRGLPFLALDAKGGVLGFYHDVIGQLKFGYVITLS
jgi:hypothetical protein